MHTFTTSNGYIMKFADKGDRCRVIKGLERSILHAGCTVKVISNMEVFRRCMIVQCEVTGRTENIDCDLLEVIEESKIKHEDVMEVEDEISND